MRTSSLSVSTTQFPHEGEPPIAAGESYGNTTTFDWCVAANQVRSNGRAVSTEAQPSALNTFRGLISSCSAPVIEYVLARVGAGKSMRLFAFCNFLVPLATSTLFMASDENSPSSAPRGLRVQCTPGQRRPSLPPILRASLDKC